MSASGPLPECAPDFMVHPVERFLGRTMLMVVGPATNDGVQLANQPGLADGFVRVDDSADFLQEHVRVLLRRFDEQLAVILAEVLSEEVEAKGSARRWAAIIQAADWASKRKPRWWFQSR